MKIRCAKKRNGLPLREQPLWILKRLELQRIAAGIEKEHRRLFAHLALKAHMRFDDKFYVGSANFVGKSLPFGHGQHDAEMTLGNIVAVDKNWCRDD